MGSKKKVSPSTKIAATECCRADKEKFFFSKETATAEFVEQNGNSKAAPNAFPLMCAPSHQPTKPTCPDAAVAMVVVINVAAVVFDGGCLEL